MMIDVGKARYKQITSWGADGLEKQLMEAMEREMPGVNEEDMIEDDSAFINDDGEEGLWQWQTEECPEGPWQDDFEDEWEGAVPIDMDGKELFTFPKSSGPGVPAEPGRDLAGKSVHNDSGDSAGRKPVFVGRVEEYSLDEGGASILRPPSQNDAPEGGLEEGRDSTCVQPRQIMHRLAGAGDQMKHKNREQSGDEGDERVSNSVFDTNKRNQEGQTVCLTQFAVREEEDERGDGAKGGQAIKDQEIIEGEDDFPGYDWKGPQAITKRWFTARNRPKELKTKDWKYEHALYPALMWYWKRIQWDEQEGDVTWAELAIDFQAATHVGLTRKDADWEEETLAWRAKIMASATRRMEDLCQENVNPGGREKTKALVGSIRPLRFPWQRGICQRPRLLRKEVVNQVLLEEATRAATEGRAPTTKHTPDIRSRGGAMWRHGGDMDHKGYEGQMMEECESEGEKEEGEDQQTRMPKTRLERRRVLNAIVWTEDEEKSIEARKGERMKTRERNRLLHNRGAAERGQHVIAPALGGEMRCMKCGEGAAWRRILQWPKTRCKARAAASKEGQGNERRKERRAEG